LLFASAPVEETLPQAKNAQRLLSLPDLAEDVEHCLQSDRYPFTATVAANGMIQRNA
jgi:phosphosulfolactate phosphohydrolase-like enzyme